MVEGYDSMVTRNIFDLPPADESGWKLIGFQMVLEEDGPGSKFYWVRRQKPEEEKVEVHGGAPQDLWARLFDFCETDEFKQPYAHEDWTAVFSDTLTYPMDMGPNRDEATQKTETRTVWTRAKTSTTKASAV